MGHEVTIGGERLGAGKKMKAYLHNYERSTHDLGYVWRSTMASGTLVPFMKEVALPGDTFDIDLNCEVLTHPTIGPLFGTYKVQLDVFQIPMRLYQGKLHMNMLGIGMDMSQIFLPLVEMTAPEPDPEYNIDNQQINPSSIWSYLGIRGLGSNPAGAQLTPVERKFNAIPYLGYWDIYKNYYANKQEEIGAVIHRDISPAAVVLSAADLNNSLPPITIPVVYTPPLTYVETQVTPFSVMEITGTGFVDQMDISNILVAVQYGNGEEQVLPITRLFKDWQIQATSGKLYGETPTDLATRRVVGFGAVVWDTDGLQNNTDTEPQIVTFPLENIDNMRMNLLASVTLGGPYLITENSEAPYGLPLEKNTVAPNFDWSQKYSQEGLALKTYNSDLFNNWISTEWIDGVDGISAVTAVDTSSGSFTIDELNLSKKIYDMLNRIAISGGSYDDWLDAVYTHERTRSAENPMYLGGLIKELVFQEVVSNAQAAEQPLGTLAGRGRLGEKHKGGKIVAKIDEPSYLMGIVSITPRIDYSQGNNWDVNLKTMNDLHKPALDEIGFQDLITDQMVWFDTQLNNAGDTTFKSAGKQPAWINYMTNVNKVYGNFADQAQQMFMVLNRRYTPQYDTNGKPSVADITTYIDPTKFNHIFADTRRDAQNFWCQIGVNIEARRKMSAKVIPNL